MTYTHIIKFITITKQRSACFITNSSILGKILDNQTWSNITDLYAVKSLLTLSMTNITNVRFRQCIYKQLVSTVFTEDFVKLKHDRNVRYFIERVRDDEKVRLMIYVHTV